MRLHLRLLAATLLLPGGAALAHDGHGLPGTHWHATDAFGLALLGVLVAVAIWLARK